MKPINKIPRLIRTATTVIVAGGLAVIVLSAQGDLYTVRQAAEQGDATAQFNLGVMYAKGEGVPQDDETAHVWLNVAASRSIGEQRDEYAEARDAVAERMTRGQLAKAQRRAREWDEASRLFPTNDSTRTTSENPSVNPPNFEYGDESELRGVKTVYLDTGFELKARNDIVDKLTADTALAVVDRPQEADVVLVFRWDGGFGTIAKGCAIIGNRLVWEFEDRRLNILQRLPSGRWKGKLEARDAVYANRRRIRGGRGRRLLRRRGELLERPCAHLYETGGMRRSHLRGGENLLKRLLIHVSAFNLGLLMRQQLGVGTPRGLQGRLRALAFMLRWLLRAKRGIIGLIYGPFEGSFPFFSKGAFVSY